MKKVLSKLKSLSCFQLVILYISEIIFRIFNLTKNVNYVIGVHEISGNIFNLSHVLDKSKSVNLNPNKFYNHKYDYGLNIGNKYVRFFINFFYAPVLLGYLCNRSNKFIYIWETGFLFDRALEFRYLKSKNKKIILFFCGDDIRSPRLSLKYSDSLGLENFLSYVQQDLIIQEKNVKHNAQISDKYADLIFNFPLCQKSYLKKKTFFPTYMYDRRNFHFLKNKFMNTKEIKILHAPSNPMVKGTPLVRAAIKKLRVLGYRINYIEIQGKSNVDVLNELKNSHIVLNSFYGLGYTIGAFGVEALANYNCLLTSISSEIPEVETPNLWKHLNYVCVNTKYWEIFDNLKFLLDNPSKIEEFASRGYEFALENFEYKKAKKYFETIFENELG